MKIKGVISDMDGVILDSERIYVRFWCEAARFFGFPMKEQDALDIRSLAHEPASKLLKGRFGNSFNLDTIREKRVELMDAYVKKYGIEAKPGAHELLTYLKKNGIKTALATATPAAKAKEYLGSVGLLEYFDVVTSVREVKRGKPAPDVYLHAAKLLGLEPGECIALEDSPNGIRSASSAGCLTVMVPDLDEPNAEIFPLLYAVSNGLRGVPEIIERANV